MNFNIVDTQIAQKSYCDSVWKGYRLLYRAEGAKKYGIYYTEIRFCVSNGWVNLNGTLTERSIADGLSTITPWTGDTPGSYVY